MKQFFCKSSMDNNFSLPAPTEIQVKVIDQFGDPLVGAHVVSDGSSMATITNAIGFASIQGYPSDKVIFSHIGKETRAIPFSGLSNQEVVLEDQIETLDEVIITNKPKKKNLWIWALAALGVGYVLTRKQPQKVNL